MGRLLVLLALVLCGHALIHKITLERERAPSLLIETFGFAVGGFQNISNTVPHFSKVRENRHVASCTFFVLLRLIAFLRWLRAPPASYSSHRSAATRRMRPKCGATASASWSW